MAPIITHISTVHSAFDVRIFYKECCSLADSGFNVNFVVTHSKNETVEGVNIIALPQINNRVLRILFKPWIAFKKALKTKADIFHFHDPELIPIGIILRLCGKKVIYDVHEDVPSQILNKEWIPKGIRKIVAYGVKFIEIIGSKIFSGIVTATPHIKGIFEKRNSNTVNINNYPLLKESLALDIASKEKNAICYVGGITKERGILELITALEGTNIKLYLAGNFASKTLENQVRSLAGWTNVDYLGILNRNQLQDVLKKSMIGVCLFHKIENHKYCLPNKIFEYWNSGIVVIASDIPYWQETFDYSPAIEFVNPASPFKIQSKLLFLLSNSQNLYENGKLGRKGVLDNYTWDTEFQKILELYEHWVHLPKGT